MNFANLKVFDAGRESTDAMCDSELIANAKAGDKRAFDQLCLRHSKMVKRCIYRITNNWEDTQDVFQDSCLKAFLKLNGFEERSKFSSWLMRIAINSALMLLRKRRNCEEPLDQISEDCTIRTWKPWGYVETPERLYMRLETTRLLKCAIRRLPPTLREVVQLRGSHDGPTREIADILGISLPAAKARLHRAEIMMRTTLPTARYMRTI